MTTGETSRLSGPVPDSLWNETAKRLLERAASAAPTPGGGSVAALSGALGFGLVIMALEITAARHDAPAGLPELLALSRAHLDQMTRHPDLDVQVFGDYMSALGAPRSTPEEKRSRRAGITDAARGAIRAPLASAQDLLHALTLAEQAASASHLNVVSDVGAGAHLLHGALHATLLNVDINLGSLPQEERAPIQGRRDNLARQAGDVHARVTAQVGERLRT